MTEDCYLGLRSYDFSLNGKKHQVARVLIPPV